MIKGKDILYKNGRLTLIAGLICLFLFLFLNVCSTKEEKELDMTNTKYVVCIGADSEMVYNIRNVDVLVIDAAYFSKEDIATIKNNNIGKVYSYLNIGSIENFRSFYEEYEQYALGDYDNWPEEKWVDVSEPSWQDFVIEEGYDLAQKGIDGFFIDNADVYYLYPGDEIYEGIVHILAGLHNTKLPIYLNGADSFVSRYIESGKEENLFAGVNQECVYTTYDFDKKTCLVNTEEEMNYFTQYLNRVKTLGYEVYVLEYATDTNLRNQAYEYAQEHRFICYVSDNIELTGANYVDSKKN